MSNKNNNLYISSGHWVAHSTGVHHISEPIVAKEPGCVWLALFYIAVSAGLIILALAGHTAILYYYP